MNCLFREKLRILLPGPGINGVFDTIGVESKKKWFWNYVLWW